MDWAYSVSDAVAMPQNTISNQAHVFIDETMFLTGLLEDTKVIF